MHYNQFGIPDMLGIVLNESENVLNIGHISLKELYILNVVKYVRHQNDWVAFNREKRKKNGK